MSGEVKIPISAEFDTRSTDKAVQILVGRINKLGESVAKLNQLKFNPVDKDASDDLARLERQFNTLMNMRPGSYARARATTQYGIYFQDPGARPGGGGNPPSGGGGGSFPGQGVVNAGLNAAGPVGQAAAGGINAGVRAGMSGGGLSGGLMAGLGGFAGMLAAAGIGKAVSAVMDKIGDAQHESIGVDTLKRMLGDVNVGFGQLRDSLRNSAEALSTNYNEALKLGTEFAKISGSAGGKGLAQEVAIAGGLSRSLGTDMGQGVGLMAQMRLSKVTSNDQDSRKLALMIGEAVGRVGFAKADELFAAVTQYTSQQTRQGMNAGNVAGYLSSLASMASSGRAGLDVGGSAALLGKANSAIVGGGAAGEAGQNFLFATLGRSMGLSPVQAKILQQQGLFGSGRQAFGGGSLYAAFSKRYGGSSPGGVAGSGTSNIDTIMAGLEKQYGSNPDMLAAAASSLFGMNESQAMAVMLHGRGGALNGIGDRLKKSGIGVNMLSATGIGALAQINSGGSDVLQAQAASLRGRTGRDALSSTERDRLDKAMNGGDVEQQKQVLTELTATREQEMTEGKATRDSIEGVERVTQKLAAELVPLATTMRDGIIAIASKLAPDSEFAKAQKQADETKAREKALDDYNAKIAKISADEKAAGPGATEDQLRQQTAIRYQRMAGKGRRGAAAALNNALGGNDYSSGADALTSAIMMVESGGRRFDKNGNPLVNPESSATGEMQVTDGTASNPGFGITPAKSGDLADRARVGKELLAKYNMLFKGDSAKAAAAYKAGYGATTGAIRSGGDNWLDSLEKSELSLGHSSVKKYVKDVQEHRIQIEVKQNGKAIASPVNVTLGAPKAAGAN